jgi:hypothetical protein
MRARSPSRIPTWVTLRGQNAGTVTLRECPRGQRVASSQCAHGHPSRMPTWVTRCTGHNARSMSGTAEPRPCRCVARRALAAFERPRAPLPTSGRSQRCEIRIRRCSRRTAARMRLACERACYRTRCGCDVSGPAIASDKFTRPWRSHAKRRLKPHVGETADQERTVCGSRSNEYVRHRELDTR